MEIDAVVLVKLVHDDGSESLAEVPYPLQDELDEDDIENERDFEESLIVDGTYKQDGKVWRLST